MNSKIVFGQYFNSNSWIHKLDPRVKLIAILLFMVGVFLIDSLYVLLGILGAVLILIFTTKISIFKFLQSMRMMTFLLVFAFVCQVLFRKTGNLLYTFNFTLDVYNLIITVVLLIIYFLLGKKLKKGRFLQFLLVCFLSFYLQTYTYNVINNLTNNIGVNYIELVSYKVTVYDDSLMSGAFILIRICLLLFMSSILTFCTKPTELNNGLEAILSPLKVFKVNVSILSMMISIALRNIPTLINEANKILKAQASRGVDFKEAKLKEKVMQIVSLIVPMFIIAFQKAEDLSYAMEARGYDPDKPRTTINVLKFKTSDYVSLLTLICLFVLVIVYKILL